jgi:hypothetical protein
MRFLPSPRNPTLSEYAVLAVAFAVVLILAGVVAIVLALRTPAAQPELAAALVRHGVWCLGIGLTIGFGFWLFRRIVG